MKIFKQIILGLLLIHFIFTASAQKFIKTDINLKASSDMMQVKRKGISVIGKYEFGPYKVVSGKVGWSTENYNRGILSDDVEITFENKKSFFFVAREKDTIHVQTSLNVFSEMEDKNALVFRKIFGWHDYEVKESKEVYISSFIVLKDSAEWNMVLIYPRPMQNDEGEFIWDNKTEFYGMISKDSTNIEIKRVFEQENGKSSLLNPIWGYEFFLLGESIAAMQYLPINKMFVWIRKDIDENLKTVVAGSIAAIFAKND